MMNTAEVSLTRCWSTDWGRLWHELIKNLDSRQDLCLDRSSAERLSLAADGDGEETHSQAFAKILNWRSPSIPPLWAPGTPWKRGQEGWKSQSRWEQVEDTKRTRPSESPRDRSSSTWLAQAALVLCVYIVAASLVFSWNSRPCEQVGPWLLCLLLRLVSSSWIAMFNFDMEVFAPL